MVAPEALEGIPQAAHVADRDAGGRDLGTDMLDEVRQLAGPAGVRLGRPDAALHVEVFFNQFNEHRSQPLRSTHAGADDGQAIDADFSSRLPDGSAKQFPIHCKPFPRSGQR